jgi:capsular exopolysaccharide synthesis family protein
MQVAANMARRGKKALLIDADLRMSVLNAQYDIQLQGSGAGLAHLLSGQCTLEDALYETSQPNLFLIPAGTDVQSPLSLIDTPDFVRMTETAGESFDLVVIDTPPIGMVIDAAEIARCCDGSILVLEYAKTHLKALQGAKQQMEKTGTPILGCVLNKVAMDRLSTRKYYSYGRKYGYRKYGRYGNKSYYRRDGKENKADNN